MPERLRNKLTNEEVGKLTTEEFQAYMYKHYKQKFFGYKPRGGKQATWSDKLVAILYDKGKITTANHLAFHKCSYGDYKYGWGFVEAERVHRVRH